MRVSAFKCFHGAGKPSLQSILDLCFTPTRPGTLRYYFLDLFAIEMQLAGGDCGLQEEQAHLRLECRDRTYWMLGCAGESSLLLSAGHVSLQVCRGHTRHTAKHQVASGFVLWIFRGAGGVTSVLQTLSLPTTLGKCLF